MAFLSIRQTVRMSSSVCRAKTRTDGSRLTGRSIQAVRSERLLISSQMTERRLLQMSQRLLQVIICLHEINAHYLKNGNANIILTIEVSGIDQLKSIILRLQKIPGVISAERTGKQ